MTLVFLCSIVGISGAEGELKSSSPPSSPSGESGPNPPSPLRVMDSMISLLVCDSWGWSYSEKVINIEHIYPVCRLLEVVK